MSSINRSCIKMQGYIYIYIYTFKLMIRYAMTSHSQINTSCVLCTKLNIIKMDKNEFDYSIKTRFVIYYTI